MKERDDGNIKHISSNKKNIFRALSRNHLEIVKKLLENGADLTIQTRSGETPLQFASSKEAYYLMNSHISKKGLPLCL